MGHLWLTRHLFCQAGVQNWPCCCVDELCATKFDSVLQVPARIRTTKTKTHHPFTIAVLLEVAMNISSVRDTKWLTLEVCRQFQRGNCSRGDEECKFAHPPKSCQVENGRVIACFDSLKVGTGANTRKSVLYVADVGWYSLVLATPNNKPPLTSSPCFLPYHVTLKLVKKHKQCQI